jgi:hypothetical protein
MANRIRVHLRVGADGTVDPASIQLDTGWRYHQGGEGAAERARAIARECRFSPARLGEDIVVMTVAQVFSFP